MKKLILLMTIFCAIVSFTVAKPLQIDFDYCQFFYNNDSVYYELYYSFPDTIMTYRNTARGFDGEFFFRIEIGDSTSKIFDKNWTVGYLNPTLPKTFKVNLFGQKTFVLPKGDYKAKITIKDDYDTSSIAGVQFEIRTKNYTQNKISVSDIELAQVIESVKNASQQWNMSFKKYDYYIIPNPSLEYVSDTPSVKAYFEIYNAKKYSPKGFIIKYFITDALNKEVYEYQKNRISNDDGLVETVELPVEILPSGSYYLHSTIYYPPDIPSDSLTNSKKFYIINPNIPPIAVKKFTENELYEKSEFSIITDEQADIEFDKIKGIVTNSENDLYEKLTSYPAKRKFLFRFWFNRDPDTSTAVNEALEKFRENENYANKFFSLNVNNQGWKTERGRVVLKYGIPTKKDTYLAEGDKRAYEQWFYDEIQGGVEFDFVDVSGFGKYILVSSTALGEMNDQNWLNKWVKISATDVNTQK
jgi:GWxTD domain-containing protein